MRFFLMSQGSFNPKIRFLDPKVCHVARLRTDTPTTYTKVKTEDALSGFQDFFPSTYHQGSAQYWYKIKNIENPSQKLILLSDNMLDYIVRLLVWAVEVGLMYRNTLYILQCGSPLARQCKEMVCSLATSIHFVVEPFHMLSYRPLEFWWNMPSDNPVYDNQWSCKHNN